MKFSNPIKSFKNKKQKKQKEIKITLLIEIKMIWKRMNNKLGRNNAKIMKQVMVAWAKTTRG